MKKFLAVLLSLVMVLSLFGPAAVALEEDAAPVEPAEAVVEAAEEKLELPEIEDCLCPLPVEKPDGRRGDGRSQRTDPLDS